MSPPSALSKFLAECGQIFGTTLFQRRNRRLEPTEEGRYVVECAQKILDQQNRMLLTMKNVTGSNRKRIRLATAPNRGAMIYSKIYKPFSRRYPDVSLELVELYATEQPRAIARGTADLALGAGPFRTDTEDIPVAYEELLISLPAANPLAEKESIRLEELCDTPFVLQGTKHSIRILADQLFREAGFQPVVAFESNDVLLAEERLADMRYQTSNDPFVVQMLENVRMPIGLTVDGSTHRALGTALQRIREVTLDTKVLEYLIAIVEEESLSGAADRFLLAQPALSRHLRSVETMVGMPLFSRDHNRLKPTGAGTIFVNNARNILRIETEMFKNLTGGKI